MSDVDPNQPVDPAPVDPSDPDGPEPDPDTFLQRAMSAVGDAQGDPKVAPGTKHALAALLDLARAQHRYLREERSDPPTDPPIPEEHLESPADVVPVDEGEADAPPSPDPSTRSE